MKQSPSRLRSEVNITRRRFDYIRNIHGEQLVSLTSVVLKVGQVEALCGRRVSVAHGDLQLFNVRGREFAETRRVDRSDEDGKSLEMKIKTFIKTLSSNNRC